MRRMLRGNRTRLLILAALACLAVACTSAPPFDILITGGEVLDGSGQPAYHADVGIPYVIVNGVLVLDNGRHTGALPGKVLRGPGYRGN